MRNRPLLAGLALAAVASSGCAPYLYRNGHSRYPVRPSHVAIDPSPQRVEGSYSADEWPAIVRLQSKITIAVLTTAGLLHEGRLIAAHESAVVIDLAGAELRIPRASVARVDVLESPADADAAMLAEAELKAFARDVAIDSARATLLAVTKTFVGPAAAPLLRLGAPALTFGGARSAILDRQPRIAMPSPFIAAPPIVSQPIPSARRTPSRPAICHTQPVKVH